MGSYPLIEIQSNLDEATRSIESAAREIDDVEMEGAEFEAFLNSMPELKQMYHTLNRIHAELKTIWTPDLKRRLTDEEARYDDEEARADAMSY